MHHKLQHKISFLMDIKTLYLLYDQKISSNTFIKISFQQNLSLISRMHVIHTNH